MSLILFILRTIEINIRQLCLSVSPQQEILWQHLCCKQCKIVMSQYKKIFTIWELGKNKFT
jgi:hypothetical protein